jgi:sialidase-1
VANRNGLPLAQRFNHADLKIQGSRVQGSGENSRFGAQAAARSHTCATILLCLFALCARCFGAENFGVSFTDLFVSGADGYHTYRIPVLLVSKRGTLLAFCEGRKHASRDSGKVDLLLKRSTDGGRTWSPQQIVWADGENTCGNPAPVQDETTGTIWLLMTRNLGSDNEDAITRGSSRDTRRVFISHSLDDGLSWSAPKEITSAVKKTNWFWYATGPVNGIQLARGAHKGRLVIPANHSELSTNQQPITRSHIIFSDDHGENWQLGGSEEELTNESTVVERLDGSLLHNMRSYHKEHRRAVAVSTDGGASWSPVRLDEALIEPLCQASILRAAWPEKNQKNIILFSNPASLKRENLTVRLSNDEGATWPLGKVLYAGPSAYSCLAVLPDNSIACLFERGEKSPYEKLTLARFPLRWLEEK